MTDLADNEQLDSATPADRPSRKKMTLFAAADGVGLFESETMTFPEFADGDMEAAAAEDLQLAPLADGLIDTVLYRGEGDEGFSLVRADFAPNYMLPRHSHNADCLYYIVAGSLTMGSRTLTAGDGFFVPSDGLYGYQAGPDGATVLEFRVKTSFDMKVPAQLPRIRQMAEVATANAADWKQFKDARS